MNNKKNVYFFYLTLMFLFFVVGEQNCSYKNSSTRKLKILFVTSKFPYATRPYTDNQIVGLINRGHDVYILAKCPGRYADYPLAKQYNFLKRTYYFDQIYDGQALPNALKNIDIIYCQFAGWLSEYCLKMIKEKNMKARLIVCFRGGDATGTLISNPHRYDDLFKKADFFLPVCDYFKENIIKHGCDQKKIKVHHSAVDCNKFRYRARTKPKDGTIKFILVATLSERKGIRYVLYAMDKLRRKYPNIKLTIIGGDCGQKEKTKKIIEGIIKELHLERYVSLLGFQLHRRIIYELYRSHVFLLTPYTRDNGVQEGIPNALMEAMATGLPVISSYNGGIPELIKDRVSGFLVPEKNVDMLVEKMAYLIRNPHRWRNMGKSGSNKINREHSKDKAIVTLEEIFFSVLKKK